MKLQGMSIVYVLIILPIFFVITMALFVFGSALRSKADYDTKILRSIPRCNKSF